MAVGTGAAAAAPDVWVAAACVVVSGAGNGAAVVCNALLVQRGAPDRLRGRAFTMLMSANMVILTLGMVLAGHLTRGVGPRWIWGLAAMLSAASGLVGFALARGVPEHPSAASSADAEQEVLPPAEPAGQTAQRGL
jgi:MFS family permease